MGLFLGSQGAGVRAVEDRVEQMGSCELLLASGALWYELFLAASGDPSNDASRAVVARLRQRLEQIRGGGLRLQVPATPKAGGG